MTISLEHCRQVGHPRQAPPEWRSGGRLWLIDVVAPAPALPTVLATLRKEVFKGAKVSTMLRAPRGKEERE